MAVVGEIATGVASSLVFESMKRPIFAIQAEIQRRKNISRALNDKAPAAYLAQERRVDLVVSDLARVIGNKEGKLTAPVAQFLSELQRTAFPHAVVHSALCGIGHEPLLPSFESFATRFSDIPFTPKQLLDALFEAAKVRLEAVNDPAMLEILRAQHGEVSNELRLLTLSLARLSEDRLLDHATVRDLRSRVAKAVEAENRHVTVETLKGARKFTLKNLAIPGRLTPLQPTHIQSAKAPVDGESISYQSFRRSIDRAIILGDPGGGKSTLTQLMSFDLANLIGLESANPGRKDFDPYDLKVPLRIILRSYEAKLTRAPSYTIFDYICDEIKPALDSDKGASRGLLKYLLTSGSATLIFDGLDEVLDVGGRRSMVAAIEQFSEIYAACPTLVTSRLVGYRDAPLCDEFKPFGLARFSIDEVRTYTEKAIKAVENVGASAAKAKADEFISQSNKVGSDLRDNPLMLGLMVQIYANRGDVPASRPEVYRECATLMFEKWDERRGIIADVPRHDIGILDVFGYVANLVFGDAGKEEGVSKEWLTHQLRTHFNDWYVDKSTANRSAVSLVKFLTGRAWVMSEVGHEIFKFTHRTFLEYFSLGISTPKAKVLATL